MNNFLVLPQHILCPEFKLLPMLISGNIFHSKVLLNLYLIFTGKNFLFLLPMLAPERFLQFSEKVRLRQFFRLNRTLITQQTLVIRNPVI